MVFGPDYSGVDNCGGDPNCLTRRVVHRGSGATDFLPVPDATDDDGSVRCTPRPAGRVAPSFDQTELPGAGQVHVNPHHEQLAGLESWYWWSGATIHTWESPVAAGVNADCTVVAPPAAETYDARLVELVWEVGDGRPATYRSTEPGTEEDPAVRHEYRTAGRWTTAVSCVWHGQWGGTVTVPCGEREVDVIEVRGRLGSHDETP